MSISAVSGAAQVSEQIAKPRQMPPANDTTPFSQQLDAQTAQAQGHHHHPHGAASQSMTSAANAAPTAGGSSASSTAGSLAASLMQLLS